MKAVAFESQSRHNGYVKVIDIFIFLFWFTFEYIYLPIGLSFSFHAAQADHRNSADVRKLWAITVAGIFSLC